MAQTEMGHRSDEITSYLSDALEPEQKASFEAHLATCEECQTELEAQRALFDQANQALAFKPKRTIDEQVARFEREVAAEEPERRRPQGRRNQLMWGLPLALGIAASAAAVVLLVHQPDSDKGPNTAYAPRRPAAQLDGGVDGGE